MSTTASASAAERPSAYHDCGRGKLDLPCARPDAPLWRLERTDARNADKAYVIRFGDGGKAQEPRWVVQLGHAARQALFWAAVVTTFLL